MDSLENKISIQNEANKVIKNHQTQQQVEPKTSSRPLQSASGNGNIVDSQSLETILELHNGELTAIDG